jgi:hypothetical protein
VGTENDSSGVSCWPAVSVEGSVEGEGSRTVTGNVQAGEVDVLLVAYKIQTNHSVMKCISC